MDEVQGILDMAISIPQLDDVFFAVEDLKNLTITEAQNTRKLIRLIEQRLLASVAALEQNLENQISWSDLLSKYYEAVKNVNHALDIYKDEDKKDTSTTQEEWAEFVTKVDGMELWLKQYHKMMTGEDTSIFGDEPLMIQLMQSR